MSPKPTKPTKPDDPYASYRRRRKTTKHKHRHKLVPPTTDMTVLPIVRTDNSTSSPSTKLSKLSQYRGLRSKDQAEIRRLDERSRLELIADMERELDVALDRIVPVPKENWTPIDLAVASGLSVSQVTRVFHDNPKQQRWRQFASDLRGQAGGCGIPASKHPAEIQARMMALVPGHRYCQTSQGILRLARAMGISVDDLVGILLDTGV